MSDTKERLFTIHFSDRGTMPDAPPDPTSKIVQGMIETVNREIERGLAAAKQFVDATIDRANEAEAELSTARAENERLRGELAKALADVDQLRKTADAMARALHEAHERDTRLTANLNTAAMGRIAARGEADRLCAVAADFGAQRDEARDERDRISAICKKAIAERDEARKALAELRAGDIMGKALDDAVSERESLRARVAELEAMIEAAEVSPPNAPVSTDSRVDALCRLMVGELDRDRTSIHRATIPTPEEYYEPNRLADLRTIGLTD